MGSFYTNVALRFKLQDKIARYLKKARRNAYVSPSAGEYTFIYDERCEQNPKALSILARKLSQAFNCLAFAVMNYDDDILYYWLYNNGNLIDTYDSSPGYFEGKERPPKGGNPEKLQAAFKAPVSCQMLQEILHDRTNGNGYVYQIERHRDLCKVLGISIDYSTIGFTSIDKGDIPNLFYLDKFIQIGSGPSERIKKMLSIANHEKQQLMAKNVFLVELQTKKIPQWCFSPSHPAEIMVSWSDFLSKEPHPIEYYKAPWSSKPEKSNLKLTPTVHGIVADPSGRYLAAAHASGHSYVELWDLQNARLLATIPHTRAVQAIAFSGDGENLFSLSCDLSITPLSEPQTGKTIEVPGNNCCLALHPYTPYAVIGSQGKLMVVNTSEMRIEKDLFVGEIQGNTEFIEKYLATIARECSKEEYEKRKDFILKNIARRSDIVFALKFSNDGTTLFAATSQGVKVFLWQDIISAYGEMPRPLFSASANQLLSSAYGYNGSMAGNTMPSQEVIAYDIAFDSEKNMLLFANLNGTICYIDLSNGYSNVLLKTPGQPALVKLRLSEDRKILACTSKFLNSDGPAIPPSLQIWNYELLWEEHYKKNLTMTKQA